MKYGLLSCNSSRSTNETGQSAIEQEKDSTKRMKKGKKLTEHTLENRREKKKNHYMGHGEWFEIVWLTWKMVAPSIFQHELNLIKIHEYSICLFFFSFLVFMCVLCALRTFPFLAFALYLMHTKHTCSHWDCGNLYPASFFTRSFSFLETRVTVDGRDFFSCFCIKTRINVPHTIRSQTHRSEII